MTARRAFLGLAAGAAVSVTAQPALPASVHPDAVLIEACATLDALEAELSAVASCAAFGSLASLAAEAERDCILGAQKPYLARIIALRAVTRDGQVARARSLVQIAPDLMTDANDDTAERLMRAVLRDVIG